MDIIGELKKRLPSRVDPNEAHDIKKCLLPNEHSVRIGPNEPRDVDSHLSNDSHHCAPSRCLHSPFRLVVHLTPQLVSQLVPSDASAGRMHM